MPRGQHAAHDLIAAQRTFNSATVTVGGLFIATHSIVVTVTGNGRGHGLVRLEHVAGTPRGDYADRTRRAGPRRPRRPRPRRHALPSRCCGSPSTTRTPRPTGSSRYRHRSGRRWQAPRSVGRCSNGRLRPLASAGGRATCAGCWPRRLVADLRGGLRSGAPGARGPGTMMMWSSGLRTGVCGCS